MIITRLHRMHEMHTVMWCGFMQLHCTQMAEQIKILLGVETQSCLPKEHFITWGVPILPRLNAAFTK